MKKTTILLLIALSTLMFSCTHQLLNNDFCDCALTPVIRTIGTDTFKIPNIFTPNGDGINDMWTIKDYGSHPTLTKKIYKLGIINTLIYQDNGTYTGWDGTYNGSPVPNGKYEYEVSLGGTVITGYVGVFRSGNPNNYNCISGCTPIDANDPLIY